MRDELLKKLDRISNLDDRRLLKNILINVFDPIVEHNMSMYETLRENIYNEIEDSFEKYYIYTTVDSIENIDPISSFYHPMVAEDVVGDEVDFGALAESLEKNEETIITTLFMQLDYMSLRRMIDEQRSYKCTISTDKDVVNTKVFITKSKKYLEKIEELYKVFQFNEKDWKTVNSGFAHKFINVVATEPIKLSGTIKQISIDLGEYEKYKKPNYVMLWNVEKITLADKTFPKPLEDSVHYEHSLNIEKTEQNCGFLVDNSHDYIKYMKQTEEHIVIANNTDEQDVWNIVKIEDADKNIRKDSSEFIELTNVRNLGFIGRFANEKALIIRTHGELARIFESYQLSNELNFKDVEISEKYDKSIKTIDYDYFIDNNLRNDPKRSYMILKFLPKNREDFLLYEKISFFVSIAGLMFPEYRCVGEIV